MELTVNQLCFSVSMFSKMVLIVTVCAFGSTKRLNLVLKPISNQYLHLLKKTIGNTCYLIVLFELTHSPPLSLFFSPSLSFSLYRRHFAIPEKYGSINRYSAINFYLTVLIYPIIALGCFAMSNVVWRWAFIFFNVFPLAFVCPYRQKKCLCSFAR